MFLQPKSIKERKNSTFIADAYFGKVQKYNQTEIDLLMEGTYFKVVFHNVAMHFYQI